MSGFGNFAQGALNLAQGATGVAAPKQKKKFSTKKWIFLALTIVGLILFIVAAIMIGAEANVGGAFMFIFAFLCVSTPVAWDLYKYFSSRS